MIHKKKNLLHTTLINILSISFVLFPSVTSAASPTANPAAKTSPTPSISDQRKNIERNPQYDPKAEFDTCDPTPGDVYTSTTDTGVPGGKLYMLGDSITVMGINNYDYRGMFSSIGVEATFSAEGARSWRNAGAARTAIGTSGSGKNAANTDRNIIAQSGAILMALGTNDGSNNNPVEEMYNTIRSYNPTAPIYWINVAASTNGRFVGPFVEQFNKDLNEKLVQTGKVKLIDWSGVVDPGGNGRHDPAGLLLDGIHPNAKGFEAMKSLLKNSLQSKPSSTDSAAPAQNIGQPATSTAPPYKQIGIIPAAGMQVGATIFGGTYKGGVFVPTNPIQDPGGNNGPPDDNGQGNGSGPLPGTVSFAELSNNGSRDFSALGKLPNGTKLEITYNGKSVVAYKGDVGSGGGDIEGRPRAIDLWWETARLLDFKNGTGVVTVRPVDPSTPVTPVNGQVGTTTPATPPTTDVQCQCLAVGGTTTAPSTPLNGSNNVQMSYNYFISKGLTPNQVGGIMGNLMSEGGPNLNPKRVQGTKEGAGDRDTITVDGKTGYGIAQWTWRERQQGLVDLSKSRGMTIQGDLGLQLDYFWYELTVKYKPIYTALQTISDLRTASDLIMVKYENPADQSEAKKRGRAALGQQVVDLYGGGGGGALPVPSSTTSTSCVDGPGDTPPQATGFTGFPLQTTKLRMTQLNGKQFQNGQMSKSGHPYAAHDILADPGTPVAAISEGKVVHIGSDKCGGALLAIYNSKIGVTVAYLHTSVSRTIVKEGDNIAEGQLIGYVGSAGEGCGTPHLHIDANDTPTRIGCKRENCPEANRIHFQAGSDKLRLPQSLYENYMKLP